MLVCTLLAVVWQRFVSPGTVFRQAFGCTSGLASKEAFEPGLSDPHATNCVQTVSTFRKSVASVSRHFRTTLGGLCGAT